MRIKNAFVLGLLLALSAAGCGNRDGGTDGVASVTGDQKASASAGAGDLSNQERALEFAKCMRENGVPNFPDPEDNAGGAQIKLPEGADPKKVDAAMKLCKDYLPNGGVPQKADAQELTQQRAFAKCMRENGVPNFPDPGTEGGIKIDPSAGINPQDPKFQEAQKACDQYKRAVPSGSPSLMTRGTK